MPPPSEQPAPSRGRQPQRSKKPPASRKDAVDRSPFFRPSTPRTLIKVQTPGGTVRLKKKVKKSEEAKSGILGTYCNLVTCIVGSGIVGIPFAIRESGLVAGTVLVFFSALLTDKSLRLLIETGKHVDVPSYETLMEAAFGRFGFLFITVNMFISSYGGCVSYLIIIKDTIPALFGVDVNNDPLRRAILVVSSMAVSLPLATQRDMANLSKTSAISFVFDLLMVAIVLFFSPVKESVAASGGLANIISNSTLRPDTLFVGFGVLSFAFVCQDSSFIIAGSLDRPTKDRWAKVTGFGLLTCGILAGICGVCGYLAFQSDTEGNVLNNFDSPDNQIAATAARALLGSTMFFVYPLSSYVVRHVLVVLLFQGRTAHEGDDHAILARKDRRIAMTVLIYILALVPALFVEDLGTVLAFAGSIAGSCLSYIGPGAAYLAVHGGEFLRRVIKSFGKGPSTYWFLGFPVVPSHLSSQIMDAPPPAAGGEEARSKSETLPLTSSVGYPLEQDDDTPDETPTPGEDPSCIIACLGSAARFILWYVWMMPLWCSIASLGINRISDFQEKEALKSPRPNRLGKIMHQNRTERLIPPSNQRAPRRLSELDEDPETETSPVKRPAKVPSLGHIPPGSYSYGATAGGDGDQVGNQAISKAIASSIKRASASSLKSEDSSSEGEEDPQEANPAWGDFLVAIGFLILGVVAATAGISSTVMNA